MRNSILASLTVLVALLAAHSAVPAAQGRQAARPGFVAEGIPEMPNPPGPAPKRDLSGAWVGPIGNRAEPVPPMTTAGEAVFKQRKGYGSATQGQQLGESNDPFSTCDPLGFPRNLIAHAVSSRGNRLFGTAPDRIIMAYDQQRVWREIWMDGRELPKVYDVKGAPESRYYGYSVGHWENDTTLVVDTNGLDSSIWIDEAGHPISSTGHVQERYERVDQYNIQLTVTVDDAKRYTKPWTLMRARLYWMKAQEFPETLCVPSGAIQYRDTLAKPSGVQLVP